MFKILILCLFGFQAFASGIPMGIRLYQNGMYDLAAKSFESQIKKMPLSEFKSNYRIIYRAFIKANDTSGLGQLILYWQGSCPSFKKGELSGIKFVSSGRPFVFSSLNKTLSNLSIDQKVGFFKALSVYPFNASEINSIILLGEKNLDVKGALKESGFLESSIRRLSKGENYAIIDRIFDIYGSWFTSPFLRNQYVNYLERKGEYAKAVLEAKKLFKNNPSDANRLTLARALYLNGDYKSALKASNDLKNVKYLKAWCYYKLNRINDVVKVLNMKVSKPKPLRSLDALLNFFKGKFNFEGLKKFYPKLYIKSLLFSFNNDMLKEPILVDKHDLGFLYYETGNYNMAVKVLEKAMTTDSKSPLVPRTLYLLGKLTSINEQPATVLYQNLSSDYSNTPYCRQSLVPLSRIYIYNGNYLLASKLLNYAVSLGMKNDNVYRLLGLSNFYMGKYNRSLVAFNGIKRKNGEDLNFMIYDLFKLKRYGDSFRLALTDVKHNNVLSDVNAGRLVYLSNLLNKNVDVSDVNESLPNTLRLMLAISSKKPRRVEKLLPFESGTCKLASIYYLANFYEDKKPLLSLRFFEQLSEISNDENIRNFSSQMAEYIAFKVHRIDVVFLNNPEFIANDPENSILPISTLISKAQDYMDRKDYLKAYGLLKLCLKRSSSTLKSDIVFRMVNIDIHEGNFKRALEDLSYLPEGDIRNFLLFEVYSKMGNDVDAYSYAEKVKDFKSIPKAYETRFLAKLASYYKLTGKTSKALALTDMILNGNMNTISYDNLVTLGLLLNDNGRFKDAKKLFEASTKKAKNDEQRAESTFWLASSFEKAGDRDDALLNYLKVYYNYQNVEPWSVTALYRAAQLLENEGKLGQALSLYKEVVNIKGNSKEGRTAALKVNEIEKRIKEAQ